MSGRQAPRTLGVVLAGGSSRRMGGGDKGLLALAGEPMISHVARRLAPQVEGLVLNGNGDASRFEPLGLPILADTVPGRPGPLAGILAGLAEGRRRQLGHIVTVPCDAPFIPSDLVARLQEAAQLLGVDGAVAASGGRRHGTVALWPMRAAANIEAALQRGERRLGDVIAGLGLAVAEWPHSPFDPFFNVNTPDDAKWAEAHLGMDLS
jgi:molybdenum cofactor guanylyltransferase